MSVLFIKNSLNPAWTEPGKIEKTVNLLTGQDGPKLKSENIDARLPGLIEKNSNERAILYSANERSIGENSNYGSKSLRSLELKCERIGKTFGTAGKIDEHDVNNLKEGFIELIKGFSDSANVSEGPGICPEEDQTYDRDFQLNNNDNLWMDLAQCVTKLATKKGETIADPQLQKLGQKFMQATRNYVGRIKP